jgi:hypothetical protein
MKTKMSPILWVLIAAFTSQGALPGVVICVEPAGKVEFEALADKCCFGTTKPAGRSTAFLLTVVGSEAGGYCGPCTDSPISPAPVTKPKQSGDVGVYALVFATRLFDSTTIETNSPSVTDCVARDASLIPIKTTTLLI